MNEDRTIEHDNVGAYVADALDQQEREEFESHMAGCEVCTREVGDFAETLAELTFATQLTPPADLRESVLTAIARVRPLPPLRSDDAEPRPRHALSLLPTAEYGSEESDDDKGRDAATVAPVETPAVAAVTQLADVRARRLRRVLSLAVAAALVAVVALGVSVVNLNQDAKRQQQVAGSEVQLLAAPDAKVFSVKMQDGSKASYVVSKSQNRAMFIGANVAGLPSDKVYQLWTTADAATFRSAGTFSGTGEQRVFINGNVADTKALAITIEPSNGGKGSTAPTVTKDQPFAFASKV